MSAESWKEEHELQAKMMTGKRGDWIKTWRRRGLEACDDNNHDERARFEERFTAALDSLPEVTRRRDN